MKINVTHNDVVVLDAENFKAFSVEIATDRITAESRLLSSGAGDLISDEHANINIDFITKSVGQLASKAEWRNSFQAMIDYARQKNWLMNDETGIRGHTVWSDTA